MTPLARAEKFLTARLLWLERQLPIDGGDGGDGSSASWAEYVHAVHALTQVRQQLYGRPLGATPPDGVDARPRRRA